MTKEADTSIEATEPRKNVKELSRDLLLRELYDYLKMQRKRQADPKRMRAVILGYQVLLEHVGDYNPIPKLGNNQFTPKPAEQLAGLRLPGIDGILATFNVRRTFDGDAQVVEDRPVLPA